MFSSSTRVARAGARLSYRAGLVGSVCSAGIGEGFLPRQQLLKWASLALLAFVSWLQPSITSEQGRLSFSIPEARADNVQYAYDQLGRLIEAANIDSGQAIFYSYDADGNITSVSTNAITSLALAGFSPTQGSPGTQVTLSGTGFDPNSSADTVTVNGAAASVVSASSTQLVITVPAGATTGPIGISTSAGTITSSGNFVVLAGQGLPTMSGFSPSGGPAGTVVSITGTNFQAPAYDTVLFNGLSATPTSATSTGISVPVPSNATSGRIQVSTPFGDAISANDFFVPPPGFTMSNIGTSGRIASDASSNTVTLSTANQIAMELFDGSAGQYLTLGISSNSFASAVITVLAPNGGQLVSATVTTSTPAIQLPVLPATGTYTIVVNPGANTGSITFSLAAPLVGSASLNGSPVSLNISPAGRRALVGFVGAAGENISVTISGSISSQVVTILNPDGSILESDTFGSSGGSLQPQLTIGGNYTIFLNPNGALGGTATISLTSPTAPALDATHTFDLTVTDQTPATLSFSGARGQYLTLLTNEQAGGISSASITVKNPDGTQAGIGAINVGSGCKPQDCYANVVINLGPLPATGTYNVVVQQTSAGSGTLHFSLVNPVTATLPTDGTQTNISVATAQSIVATFSARAGSYMSVAFSSSAAGLNNTVGSVIDPEGNVVAGVGVYVPGTSGGYGFTSVGPLPLSGVYTVVLQQPNASSGTVQATVIGAATASIAVDGPPVTVTTNTIGQGMVLTYSATAGSYQTLRVGQGQNTYNTSITVVAPDGSTVATGITGPPTCTGSCGPNPPPAEDSLVQIGPLPFSGTYSIVVTSTKGAFGPLTFELISPLTGALNPDGSVLTEQISHPAQGVLLTFQGTAGQYMTLVVDNPGNVPDVLATVLDPNGGMVVRTSLSNSVSYAGNNPPLTTQLLNLGPLAVSGTYSVIVQQYLFKTGAIQFWLTTPVAGSLQVNNQPATFANTAGGQSFLLNFNGVAGKYLGLTVSEQGNQIPGAAVSILTPSGSALPNSLSFQPNSGFLSSGALPSTGTYGVLVRLGTISAQGSLTFTLTDLASTATLTSSPNPAGVGQPVALTANLSGPLHTPTGTVTFLDGTTTLGSASLSSGVSTYTTSALGLGTHSITASYAGDTYNAPTVSPTVTQTIASAWTTKTTLSSSSNPSASGNPVTLTAAVTGNSPTGTVSFYDGQTLLGVSAVASGTATFVASSLGVGTHNLSAAYSGDSGNTASSSAILVQTVKQAASVAWVTSPPTTATVGQSFNVQVQVSGTSPTGTVVFLDGAMQLATATLVSGQASATLTLTTTGPTRTIAAQYSGDAGNSTAQATANVAVSPATASMGWTTAPPSQIVTTQSFPVQVQVSGYLPTGTVTFKDGATTLTTAGLTSGSASATLTPTSTVGPHSLTATYAGNSNNTTASTTPVTLTVNGPVTPTISWVSGYSPPANVTVGQSFSVKVQVSGAGATYGTTAATGSVTFYDNGTSIGSATLSGGVATTNFSFSSTGTHSITAQYSGDSRNSAVSLSATNTTASGKVTPTLSWVGGSGPPSSIATGYEMSLQVSVTGAGPTAGSTSPTGTVTFLDGTTTLRSVAVSSGIAAATISMPTASSSPRTLNVQYSGDASNLAGSLSASISVTQLTPSVYWHQFKAPPATVNVNNPITVGVDVASPHDSTWPGGTVTFYDGNTQLASASLSMLVSYIGTATATFSMPNLGNRTLKVQYSGDTNNVPVTFDTTTINVINPHVVVSPSSLSFGNIDLGAPPDVQSVVVQNTGDAAVTFSSSPYVNGTNPGYFSVSGNTCTSALAPNATCQISVTGSAQGNATVSANLQIPSNAANGTQTVPMSGTSRAPVISLSKTSFAFGNQALGTTSASQTETVTNTGPVTLNINQISTSSDVLVSSNTCFAPVAPNQTCTFALSFSPIYSGNGGGQVTVTDSKPYGGYAYATATGYGVAPSISGSSIPAFGNQVVNTTSAPQTMTVTNNGTVPTTISSVTAGSSQFQIASNSCGSLAVNQACSIQVTFAPSDVGAKNAYLNVQQSYGSGISQYLSGTGVAPKISYSPASLIFGNQQVGSTSASQTLTAKNVGTSNLTISGASVVGADPADFAIGSGCNGTLAPNATCTFGVTFSPAAAAGRDATLQLNSNTFGSLPSVALHGTGLAPQDYVSPSSIIFDNQPVGSASPSQTVTITNTGTSALTVSGISMSGTNPGDFAVTGQTCGAPLAVNQSCTASFGFVPTAIGLRNAVAQIASNSSNGPLTVALRGTGVGASASLTPPSYNYGNQVVGNTSPGTTFTLTNTGNASMSVTGVALSGTNATDYALSSNACSSSLAAGQSCNIVVAFKPAAMGSRTAMLQVSSSGVSGVLSAPLTGTGVAPYASLSPTSIGYGDQVVGSTSSAQTITVTNTGTSTLTVSSLTLAGSNPGDFAISSNSCSTVAPNGSCTVAVTFNPVAMGSMTATLQIASDAINGTQSATLSGTGVAPIASVSPASVGYGDQVAGSSSSPQTVTVTNTGTSNLTVSGVALAGSNASEFAIVTNGCTSPVPPNGACTASVRFSPVTMGAKSATLQISSDASNGQQNVLLSGTSVAPVATMSTYSIAYGSQIVGTSSSTRSVTLTNTGTSTLTVSSVTLQGSNPGDFNISSNNCTTVAPNSSCAIGVVFKPTAMYSRAAALSIASDAYNGPQTVSLSGTGIAPVAGTSPSSVTYPNQGVNTTSAPSNVVVSNSGTSALHVSALTFEGANPGDFAMASNGCTSAVAAGSSCTLGITYKPTAIGNTRSATLRIKSDAFNGDQTVSLSGSATVKIVQFTANPSTVTAGSSTTLSWTTFNANACQGSGDTTPTALWNGSKATNGSQSYTPAGTPGTYSLTLTCTDTAGNSTSASTSYNLQLH